jgi:hypothetical protein
MDEFVSAIKKELSFDSSFKNYALSTFPDLKQDAQTYSLFGVPLTLHFTDLMLDFHILLDLL